MEIIRKQVGILAGSILLTSSVGAAITPSMEGCCGGSSTSDSSAILVLSNRDNGAYVYDTGLTTTQLINAPSFSIDLSAASSALGGNIDAFALFGVLGGIGYVYSSVTANYVDVNAGIVYMQSNVDFFNPDPYQFDNMRAITNAYITNIATGGFFPDSSIGDLDSTILGIGFNGIGVLNFFDGFPFPNYSSGIVNLYSQIHPDPAALIGGYSGTVIQQHTSTAQVINENFVYTSVPIPATAWLFGSGLLGLAGLAKRKESKQH